MSNYKVCKFGGTSMASANSIKKVIDIIQADAMRRFIVASAPGKRNSGDKKVTDLLIELADLRFQDQDYTHIQNQILERVFTILKGLNITSVYTFLERTLKASIKGWEDDSEEFIRASIYSFGEFASAIILTEALKAKGVECEICPPFRSQMILEGETLKGKFADSKFEQDYPIKNSDCIQIIPGFYGITKEEKPIIFDRGGSDISGAIVARMVGAKVYENWTDVNGLYMCNPNYISDPLTITNISFREVREMAYNGCNALHHSVIEPLIDSGVRINVRNTFNPEHNGTWVSQEVHDPVSEKIIGIASKSDFCVLSIYRFGMNDITGFANRITTILYDYGIPFDHAPSGLDNIDFYIQSSNLTDELMNKLIVELNKIDDSIEAKWQKNQALICVVGEIAHAKLSTIDSIIYNLRREDFEVNMVLHTKNSPSTILGVDSNILQEAVRGLYFQLVT